MKLFLLLFLSASSLAILEDGAWDTGSSDGYLEAAKYLNEAINQSVDPCDDFDEFACGKWKANNPIPKDSVGRNPFWIIGDRIEAQMKELLESDVMPTSVSDWMLKNLYKSCMNMDEVNKKGPIEMLKHIESIGYWPMVHNSLWKNNSFDLTKLFYQTSKYQGTAPFLSIATDIDGKNATRRVLVVDQGILGLPTEYYLNKEKYASGLKAYQQYLVEKTQALAEDAGLPVDIGRLQKEAEEIIQLETQIAEIQSPANELRNHKKRYNLRRLDDLGPLFPLIDWSLLLDEMSRYKMSEYFDTNPDVIVYTVEYLQKLTNLLLNTDPRVIVNLAMSRVSASYSNNLGDKYDDITQKFSYALTGRKMKQERWKICIAMVTDRMYQAAGSLYVRKHFDQDKKNTTLSMIGDIKEALYAMIDDIDWMKPAVREAAKLKAQLMVANIGFQDFLLDDKKLDSYYRELSLSPYNSFVEMIHKLTGWTYDSMFNKLLQVVDRSEFHWSPTTVNARYEFNANSITFYAGIIQPPFFNARQPKALNYGSIGAIIGHEITHGFDTRGSQHDTVGTLRDWWDDETQRRYKEKTDCFVEQYGNITIPEVGRNLDGLLTAGENIADNGGIREAFKAYQSYLKKNGPEPRLPTLEQYDNEQMFFLGYAQTWCDVATPQRKQFLMSTNPHTLPKYRINAVLQNQPEFAAAFKCPTGSPMNPVKKCILW